MVISIGGAYIRLWRPGTGLAAEVPTGVVSTSEGEVIAIGDAAAAMEGKLSQSEIFQRPFFADKIIHREHLRALIQKTLELSAPGGPAWERLTLSAAIPPTMPRLHQDWLMKTLREAGLGFVRPVDPWATLVAGQTKQRKDAPVMGVIDWGFSGVRAAVYAGGQPLVSRSWDHLSIRAVCQAILMADRMKTHRVFPLSSLYSLQWGLAQTGFDEQDRRPVTATLNKEVVHQTLDMFRRDALQQIQALQGSLSAEQAAFLRSNGWIVIGGGAALMGEVELWEKVVGVPVRLMSGPNYAALRSVGE